MKGVAGLFFLAPLVFVNFAFAAEGQIPYPFMVSAGAIHTCALDGEGVKCWGSNKAGQCNVPLLVNPRQVTSGFKFTCALDDVGAKCWGDNYFGQAQAPKLERPFQISAGANHACALDAKGVSCWGEDQQGSLIPPLKHPKQISAGSGFTCALDDDGVKCWGANNSYGQTDVPPLKKPTQVVASYDHACALDEDGIKCWGRDQWRDDYKPPRFFHPTQLSAGVGFTCALSEGRVKCWGWGTGNGMPAETDLDSLTAAYISAGDGHVCAVDIEGVKCYGRAYDGQVDVPPLILPTFTAFLATAAPGRAKYFSSLMSAATDCMKSGQGAPSSPDYYLPYALASPAVFSMDSAFYVEKMIPAFRKYLAYFEKYFGYRDLNDALEKMPDTPLRRKFALTSIKSALEVAMDFVNPGERADLQEALRVVGRAIADPQDSAAVRDVMLRMDQLKTVKQKLSSSNKSAFLLDTLKLAADWLRRNVR